jgi:hypothetical protein
MTKLLEIRESLKNFYGKYENFIMPALKFILALVTFLTINGKMGFMEKFAKFPIALILALLCSFLPMNFIVIAAAVLCLLHVYALSLEAVAVVGIIFMVLFLLYFRFSPKDTLVVVLLPLAFAMKIPCSVTLAVGLLGTPVSALSTACGVIVYYTLHFVVGLSKSNGIEISEMATKFKSIIDGIVGNKGMLVAVIAFSVTVLAVYFIRRMNIDHAWTIAMIVGALLNVLILFVGDLALSTQVPVFGTIIGTIIGFCVAVVIKFFAFNLDYARTEKVQFEDDEYYYFVKAVPKVTLAASDKKVKKVKASENGSVKAAVKENSARREVRGRN